MTTNQWKPKVGEKYWSTDNRLYEAFPIDITWRDDVSCKIIGHIATDK